MSTLHLPRPKAGAHVKLANARRSTEQTVGKGGALEWTQMASISFNKISAKSWTNAMTCVVIQLLSYLSKFRKLRSSWALICLRRGISNSKQKSPLKKFSTWVTICLTFWGPSTQKIDCDRLNNRRMKWQYFMPLKRGNMILTTSAF